MLPVLQGQAESARESMFWERQGEYGGRVGRWKLVNSRRGSGLFDLTEDAAESRDLTKDLPDVLRRVRRAYRDWAQQMADAEPRGPFKDY